MKSYRRSTISDKIKPKRKSRALKEFGIAFILAFICGTVLAIVWYKYSPSNDTEPPKGTSSDTDKESIIQISENGDSSVPDQNNEKDNKETEQNIDIIHIQNLDEQITFEKFEAIYNEYYDKTEEENPERTGDIYDAVSDVNRTITMYFLKVSTIQGNLSSTDHTHEFRNEELINPYLLIINESLDFLKKYTEQGVGAFGKLNEDKKPTFLDNYINYLTINEFMVYILNIMTKEFRDKGRTIVNVLNEKLKTDKEMNKFALKNYTMLKQIKEGMFKTIKSEMFDTDYINNVEKEEGYKKVEVVLVDKFEKFIRFFQLSFFNVIFYIFEFDGKQNRLVVTKHFWKYLTHENASEEYLIQMLGHCEKALSVYTVISKRNDQDKGQCFKFKWNQDIDKCFVSLRDLNLLQEE
eukprot:GAHX01003905.1.p1 GENE.GAHX01003905.1~~GAHX01003905.1.p1  ORF type:complete len:409 (+),score=80.83 GAHX01003905.1:56-1282(+)